jgi:hypothetical protein
MANDLPYKASLHLGASPQNKRSSLLYKIPTVGNRQHQTACINRVIELQAIPTEAAWRVGSVERRHASIKLAYKKVKADIPHPDPATWLSMAVKAANDAVDENGISPTYAVFGAHARPIPAL